MQNGTWKMENGILILSFLVLHSLFLILHSPAHAQSPPASPKKESGQTGFSLGIYPPITHVTIQPGRGTTLSFKITNNGDPMVIETELTPFVAADDAGGVKLIDCTKIKLQLCSASNWFSFADAEETKQINTDFFIKSRETKTIKLDLFVPSNTPSADYTFTLLFSATPPPSRGTIVSQITPQLGTNIIVTVTSSSKLVKRGKVVVFSPLGGLKFKNLRLFDSLDKIPIVLQVYNSGDTVIESAGEISLSTTFWPTVRFPIPPQLVLAKTARILLAASPLSTAQPNTATGNLTSGKNGGASQRLYTLSLPRSLYLGHYRLTARLTLAPGGTPINVSTTFWALPVKPIAATITVLLLLWQARNHQLLAKMQAAWQRKVGRKTRGK